MGAQKSQPLWVDPTNVPPPTTVLYEQAEPEVLFNANGVPVYPKATGIGYTPYRDPLPELPTVYDKKGKPIRPKGVPPGYVPPGSNFPPIPKGTQLVNGPKGPTLLCKSTSIAKKCDLQDGFADGQWFGYPIAVGVMLEAPPLDYSVPLSSAPPGSFASLYKSVPTRAVRPASGYSRFLPTGPVLEWGPLTGRRKAVLIGINYEGQNSFLAGCATDALSMQAFLQQWGFYNVLLLLDDGTNSTAPPTRRNILQAVQWLVAGAAPGDSLFFFYSGHGGQQKDTSGDEWDEMDETICPVDNKTAGDITDDELCKKLCIPLPPGCRLTSVMDCCHSGTGLDLPYVKTAKGTGLQTEYKNVRLQADIVLYSGCRDDQTSGQKNLSPYEGYGLLTHAFLTSFQQFGYLTYNDLLESLRQYMLVQAATQIPQISMSRNLNLDAPFTI